MEPIQKVKLAFDLRQDTNRVESFGDHDTNFKYTRLSDTTSTSSLDSSATLMVDPFDDQKLPVETGVTQNKSSFIYVNKNGFVSENILSPSKRSLQTENTLSLNTSNPVIYDQYLVKMTKMDPNGQLTDEQSVTRSVPTRSSLLDDSSGNDELQSNNSLVSREQNGDIVINTNLTIQEPNIEITSDHIKYINLFSMLCCWCFPITGIISIIYSRMTKRYYNSRDLVNAKKYLKRSEWSLIATFFFGFTLLAVGFAFLEAYLFDDDKRSGSSHHYSLGLPK